MNQTLLCEWLGLADKSWPPDHFLLLGIPPGEADMTRIEHLVHDRMAKLRCYQLSHPEEATEGMNRIAQAFICLTDGLMKKGAPLNGKSGPSKQPACVTRPLPSSLHQTHTSTTDDTAIGLKTETDWKKVPPPVRVSKDTVKVSVDELLKEQPTAVVQVIPQWDCVKPEEYYIELAQNSAEARSGIATIGRLLERIELTRQLLLAWSQVGKHLSDPARLLSKAADELDLARHMDRIFELIHDFPDIMGHPGKPGYRVVAMARLEMTARMFKMLDSAQRQALASDWAAGLEVLTAHRSFLCRELKARKGCGHVRLATDTCRGMIHDHAMLVGSSVAGVIALLGWLVLR